MDALTGEQAKAPTSPGFALKPILAIAVLAILTVLLTWRASVLETTLEQEGEEPALVNQMAPDFSTTTLEGTSVALADFRGKKNVVVTFWASWCAPCRLEMPGLVEFYRRNHTAASDFEILAVSIDEEPKDASDFATSQKLNFLVLADARQRIARAYEVDSIPTMFVVNKDGKIIYGHTGFDMSMEYMLVRKLGLKKPEEGGLNGASH